MNNDSELVARDASIWKKVLAGAIITPIVALVSIVSGPANNAPGNLNQSPEFFAIVIGIAATAGAFIGGLLALKDYVENRLIAGQSVAWPLRLLFGLGLRSVLLWFFLILFVLPASLFVLAAVCEVLSKIA